MKHISNSSFASIISYIEEYVALKKETAKGLKEINRVRVAMVLLNKLRKKL